MPRTRKLIGALLFIGTSIVAVQAHADEFGFSSYGLGGAGFGAGATPPPGTYVTFVSAYYEGDAGAAVTLGGVVLNAGLDVKFFSQATNILYVPEQKLLNGNLGVSVTIPVGHIDIDAQVTGPLGNTIERDTSGWGLGDVNARVQLGWADATFAHTVYLQGVFPTGRYEPTFAPNIGLNRPGIDTGWAFTWTDHRTKLQFNGAVGVTFNFENGETNYDSGTDFHFEWAIGYEIAKGLLIGPVGYDYRQLSGDSGSGAVLGPFEGDVDAIGAGLSYTTLIGTTPLIINARHYQEFNSEKRFEGSTSIVSGTVRF